MICGLASIAAEEGASFAVTTELAISGYPPRDLLIQSDFVTECHQVASSLETEIPVLVGTPVPPVNDRSLPGNGVVRAGDSVEKSPANNCYQLTMYSMKQDISRLMKGQVLLELLRALTLELQFVRMLGSIVEQHRMITIATLSLKLLNGAAKVLF